MKIGFIGCGNMGGAMMHGILDSGKCTPQELMASDALEKALEARKEEMGILAAKDNKERAAFGRGTEVYGLLFFQGRGGG